MIDDLFDFEFEKWLFDNSFRFIAKFDDDIERSRIKFDYDLKTLKNSRRYLSDHRMNRIVKRLKTRYRLMYSKLIDEIITIISSNEDFKKMIQRSFDQENSLLIDKFIQEKQNDAHEHRIKTNAKNRAKFFKMQEFMNIYTTIANDYEIACKKLNLNFDKFFIFDQYFEQIEFEIELKNHQIVTFDWILEIEKVLERTLFVDDMNLNKTIIAFFVIVEYVYQYEVIRFAQIQKQSTSFINNNMSFINNIVDHVVFDVAFDIVKSLRKNVANTKIFEFSNTNQNSENNANEKKWKRELREC